MMNIQIWNDDDYLSDDEDKGPCPPAESVRTCTYRHRFRQQQFILRCMADFKSRNKTWVLLTDVDEYITFNSMRDDDPSAPMEKAPEGVPTIGDWTVHRNPAPGHVDGVISGLPEEGAKVGHGNEKKVFRNGDFDKTGPLAVEQKEIQMGGIVKDTLGQRYFLRDDVAYRDSTALPHAPAGVPTLKEVFDGQNETEARIYNDTYDGRADGEWVETLMNWTYGFETGQKALHGGHVMRDLGGRRYYFEREQALWPRRWKPAEALEARRSLPSVADGRKTIMDVLAETERKGLPLGACLSMPRLFYGSKEKEEEKFAAKLSEAVPEGFAAKDFVTLRYQYHAMKGTFDKNLLGKTIIDVSRVSMEALRNKEGALSVHRPLIYYCSKHDPQYATSLLRVNHYLDTWEAFSYRNDARSNKWQCKKCYEKKGMGADVSIDNDIQPWFKHFVQSVGKEKALMLLENVGTFVKLGNVTLWQQMQKK